MKWNSLLYDNRHQFISRLGQETVALLAPEKGEKILDIGCGTGDLAQSLALKGVAVTGIDQSAEMIQSAQRKYPALSFAVADAHHLSYENEFDAVFSNAALHWMKQPEQVLHSVWRSLKPGGRFVAEFGGKYNVSLISEAVIRHIPDYNPADFPWFFPAIGEYASLMEEAGFHVAFAQHFERPTRLDGPDGMRHWIQMFGDVLIGKRTEAEKERIISGAVADLKKTAFYGDHWIADYWRIRVAGTKNENKQLS